MSSLDSQDAEKWCFGQMPNAPVLFPPRLERLSRHLCWSPKDRCTVRVSSYE
ncbi:hypothetical protein BofuT4_P137930.1 [Botrytis cinerea T4]|uniref:Uncharacterized protein n=1 Tax=Botryotinia fuckeliana (strain T4) TaxID=999810 RepID=G2YMM1_BOTF4|nr:hypothetical protein BofuT4_P137930.1 [Botrytis cinerea T4]